MNLKELSKINFDENWLAVNSKNELYVTSKDSLLTRWLKYLVQILTLGCFSPYSHIKIEKVAKSILKQTESEGTQAGLEVVNALLKGLGPIKNQREELLKLQKLWQQKAASRGAAPLTPPTPEGVKGYEPKNVARRLIFTDDL